ncbi:MAG: flagellar biosynthesis protein FlhB [Oligoflexia bacterium]|nr:flagellar biosynthesis protein FlhB [Oligoflexia bacterium]
MAENDERSREDLTEEASPYRIEELRRKGQVAQSRELTGLIALLASGAAAYALSPRMGAEMMEFMREVFRADLSSRLDLDSNGLLRGFLLKALTLVILMGLPVALAGFVMGVFGSIAQIGSIFSADPLTPNLEKINPLQGLKKLLSLKNLFDAFRLTFKMIVVVAIAYGLVKSSVFQAPAYIASDPASLLPAFASSGKAMFLALIGALFIFAALDYGLQRWDFSKNIRMTKQEAKQEHKEREGDPMIKARIRAIQREMSRKRMMQAVKKADVIITNPTHIAIAVIYDREDMAAPKVVAKGADFLAQRIKKIAADAGVPMVENVPLARTLYKTVKVGQYIPRALYQAVAEVLAYVYRLKRKEFL